MKDSFTTVSKKVYDYIEELENEKHMDDISNNSPHEGQ